MRHHRQAAILIALALAATTPAAAQADLPMGGAPQLDGHGTATGGGSEGTTGGDGRVIAAPVQGAGGGDVSRPAKKAKRRVKCKTSRRTRTCKTYRGKTLVKVCKQKRGKKKRCRTISHAASAAPARVLHAVARTSSLIGSGWVDPTSPGIVRLYSTESPVPGRGWCSGAMIARGLVLTAAHCVFDDGEQSKQQAHWHAYRDGALQVVPGDGVSGGRSSYPHGVWNVQEVFAPSGYTKQFGTNDDTLDWAILQLAPDANGNYAGDFTGTFGATWGMSITTSTQIWSAGYPASGAFRTEAYSFGENQFFCNATPDDIGRRGDAYVLRYPCKGTGGISGGPVWARADDGSWTIVAVHNRGSQEGDESSYVGKDAYNYWFDNRFGEFWTSTIAYIRSH